MDLNLKNITFIIVSFKSDKVIYNCLNSLPKNSNKIIIENSKDINLKKDLESKYDNIEVILNENLGMGASNNIGIKGSKTQYVYILNPDVTFKKNTFENLVNTINHLKDFAIISPMHSNLDYPNYKNEKSLSTINEDIIEVDSIDGFSLILNRDKFANDELFDENFFLYLENDDLCLRAKKKNKKIYIIKSALIDHIGASSSNYINNEIEYLRNWHWMWSKFYFNKKHYGYLNAFSKVYLNLFSAKIKFLFYLITFNAHKRKVYKMRILGLLNSMIGNKSYYRLKN
tara:strand:+ start:1605 stop:2462 length:858 start_codon:yes stop_codon:yes gene_type:complete